MAAIVNTPFNFQPVSITCGSNTSYTVPSGKYAIVNCSLDVYVSGANTGVNGSGYSSSNSKSMTLNLKSGDAVTVSATSPSNQSIVANGYGVASAIVSISVNGTIVANCRASISCLGTASATTLTVTGNATFNFQAAEYNNIT